MKPFMPELVSDMKGTFVHDMSIFDNILIAHEVSHSTRGRRSGHVGLFEPSSIRARLTTELNGHLLQLL